MFVRDGLAVGQRGVGAHFTPTTVETIALPLSQPSIIKTVVDSREPFAGVAPDGGSLQERFLKLFDGRELVIVPVTIGVRVVCVVAVRPTQPFGALTELEPIAGAMAAAFQRIIREHKRPGSI